MFYSCAICGGPLNVPRWGYDDQGNPWYDYAQDEWSGYDDPSRDYAPDVLTCDDDELNWLINVGAIQNNPKFIDQFGQSDIMTPTPDSEAGPPSPASPALPDPEIQSPTSPALSHPPGESTPLGDDDGVLPDGVHPYFEEEPEFIIYVPWADSYNWGSCAQELHVPIHVSCLGVLERYLGISTPELNTTSFFEALKSFGTNTGTCLDIDYGDVEPAMGGYIWGRQRGQEYFLFNPLQSEALGQFYQHLPKQGKSVPKPNKLFSVKGDLFRKLSLDVILLIMSDLEVPDVYKMRQISPSFSSVDLGASFWKYHLLADMPWLWDIPMLGTVGIDWEQVYRTLYWGSRYDAEANVKIHGLCNRRRIWEQMCPTFASAYQENECRRRALGFVVPETLKVSSAYMDMTTLVKPMPRFSRNLVETFVDKYDDVADANISIRFDWSEQGYLIGVHILKDGQSDPFQRKMKPSEIASMETINIPGDDWFTGFIFTSRVTNPEEIFENQERQVVGVSVLMGSGSITDMDIGDHQGDKCLLHIRPGHFATGLQMRCLPDGKLFKMAIIQQSVTDELRDSFRLFDDSSPKYNMAHMHMLWRDSLPSPYSRPSTLYVADRFNSDKDVEPLDLLTLGTSEEELADITSISIAEEIGGITVTYGHRASRSIGPRCQNMKRLPINGRGGERIVNLSVIPSVLDELRVTTSRGRVLKVCKASMASQGVYDNPTFHDSLFYDGFINSGNKPPYSISGIMALWIGDDLQGFGVQGLDKTPGSRYSGM